MIKKSDILTELRRHPDKIFHLLRENDFERAKFLFPEKRDPNTFLPLPDWRWYLQQLILAPDVLGYLEEHGKEKI